MTNIHFISGLPRSGSTLLCNILCQNPAFEATATSGVVPMLTSIKDSWEGIDEFKASPNPEGKLRFMQGALKNYYNDDKVYFDKTRAAPAQAEMLQNLVGDLKILVTVRDVRDVIASLEMLWRKNKGSGLFIIPPEQQDAWLHQRGRIESMISGSGLIGRSYNIIKDALHRGFTDNMFFVKFDDLTTNPEQTMKEVYNWLGYEYYEHDFDNVKQVTVEDDAVHGINGLHDIRQQIKPVPSYWREIIGEQFEYLGSENFWESNTQSTDD